MKAGIEKELLYFIRKLINDHNIDCIIAVERKGTAVIRALSEMEFSEKLEWSWKNVISSDALGRTPDDVLSGRRILVFDDMLHTGDHLWKEVIYYLKEKAIWHTIKDNIVTAAFAVHEQCPKDRLPAHWFYNELDTESYEKLRESIIDMLQRHGSLLLDTEHIEVRAKTKCDLRHFFEAFSACGSIADFRSADNRLNLTVSIHEGSCDLTAHKFIPPNTILKDIVKKCRVIQRTKNEFAIIPICYPSVPITFDDNFEFENDVKEIFGKELNYEKGRFYSVGLLASLIVLEEVLTHVLALGPEKVEIDLPKINTNCSSAGGYTLDHLLAMYPNIDIKKLTEYVLTIANNARIKSMPLRAKEQKSKAMKKIDDVKINENARMLAQVTRKVIDNKEIMMKYDLLKQTTSYNGMTAEDLLYQGKRKLSLGTIEISIALDRLIDEAYFVTHVESIDYNDGIPRLTRTFEPDGEIVSSKIRRYTELYGLPEGVS